MCKALIIGITVACAIFFGLIFVGVPIIGLVNPGLFQEATIGPITLTGKSGIRIGSGIFLGIIAIFTFCIAFCCFRSSFMGCYKNIKCNRRRRSLPQPKQNISVTDNTTSVLPPLSVLND